MIKSLADRKVANSFNETTSSYAALSRVYRWSASADVFEMYQDLPTVSKLGFELSVAS